jgi:hypothetical protein
MRPMMSRLEDNFSSVIDWITCGSDLNHSNQFDVDSVNLTQQDLHTSFEKKQN